MAMLYIKSQMLIEVKSDHICVHIDSIEKCVYHILSESLIEVSGHAHDIL